MLFKKKKKASMAAEIKNAIDNLSAVDFNIIISSHQCIAQTENAGQNDEAIFPVKKTKLLNGEYQFTYRLPIGISEPHLRRAALDSGIKDVKVLHPTGENNPCIEVTLSQQEYQNYMNTVINAGVHAVQLEVSVISAYCTNEYLIGLVEKFNELWMPYHVIATEFISHLYVSEKILTAPFRGKNQPYSVNDYNEFVGNIKADIMRDIAFTNALTEIRF